MLIKVVVIFLILGHFYDSANAVISPVDVVKELSARFNDFKQASQKLIYEQTSLISRMKNKMIECFKSLSVVEPTPQESKIVDEAMANAFALGSDRLSDCQEKIDKFCAGSESRNFQIKNWVTRKYTFNMIVRLSVELFLRKMANQNQNYCFSDSSKQNYVKNAQEIKALNPQLIPIRNKFIDILIEIQRSNFGFNKLGTLCCSFWNYKNETLNVIQSPENRQFVRDMIEGYFGLSSSYLCFYHSEGSRACSETRNSPQNPDTYDSIIMNAINAVSKITSIIL